MSAPIQATAISDVPMSAEPSSGAKGKVSGGLRRFVVVSLTLMISFSALVYGGRWLLYRSGHIVVSDAQVKGRVHRVGARIDGQVKTVEVEPAQRVKKGDVLFRLEDDLYQATVKLCESELDSAEKRYSAEKLSIEHDRQKLNLDIQRTKNLCNAAKSTVLAAEADLTKWEREFERVKSLNKSGISSASADDAVRAQRDSARAQFEVAKEKANAADADCAAAALALEGLRVREASLEVLNADVGRARQRLAAARADLNATVVRAPEDGWIADRIIEPGGSVKVGEPVLSLWVGSPWVEAWVDEKYLCRIRAGGTADVTLPAFPGQKLRGIIESIGVLADKELQTAPVPSALQSFLAPDSKVRVCITVPADHLRVQPGLSAMVGIDGSPNDVAASAARRIDAAFATVAGTFSGKGKAEKH